MRRVDFDEAQLDFDTRRFNAGEQRRDPDKPRLDPIKRGAGFEVDPPFPSSSATDRSSCLPFEICPTDYTAPQADNNNIIIKTENFTLKTLNSGSYLWFMMRKQNNINIHLIVFLVNL